jgi:hypothetical protein
MTDVLMIALAALGFALLAGVIRYAANGVKSDRGSLS